MSPPLKSHCKRGHPLNASNVRANKLRSGHTVRKCKLCESIRDRERYQQMKAKR